MKTEAKLKIKINSNDNNFKITVHNSDSGGATLTIKCFIGGEYRKLKSTTPFLTKMVNGIENLILYDDDNEILMKISDYHNMFNKIERLKLNKKIKKIKNYERKNRKNSKN